MHSKVWLALCSVVAVVLYSGCTSDTSSSQGSGQDATQGVSGDVDGADVGAVVDAVHSSDVREEAVTVKEAEWPACDDARTPIVMVHGAFASGDTWAPHARRFIANGYCPQRLFTFDYNSTLGPNSAIGALDALIQEILGSTDALQVDLMGHSMGGSVSYAYLADATRAERVRRYVHVGSSAVDAPASDLVPMLNVASENDPIVPGNEGIPQAENVILTEEDHYSVATSEASFEAIYTFLNDSAPETLALPTAASSETIPNATVLVAGRALTFGENIPLSDGLIKVWKVDSNTAERLSDAPVLEVESRDDGRFGPVQLEAGATYEWVVQGAGDEDKPIHYYREAIFGSNPFLYLRALPAPSSLVGALLASVTFNDRSAALVIFSESQAVLAGRDTLTVDGDELLNEQTAPRENSTIAMFLYDTNENDTSDNTPVELFASFPFFAGVDIYKSATPVGTVRYIFNDRTLAVRSWPGSAGAVVAVFD